MTSCWLCPAAVRRAIRSSGASAQIHVRSSAPLVRFVPTRQLKHATNICTFLAFSRPGVCHRHMRHPLPGYEARIRPCSVPPLRTSCGTVVSSSSAGTDRHNRTCATSDSAIGCRQLSPAYKAEAHVLGFGAGFERVGDRA